MIDYDSFADLTRSAKVGWTRRLEFVPPIPPLEFVWTGSARPLSLPARPTWTGPTFPRPGPSHGPALKFTRPGPAHLLSLPLWPTRALPGLISTRGSYFPARRRTHPLAYPPGPGLDPPASLTRPLCPHHASRVLRCRCAPAFWPSSPLTRADKVMAGHHRRQTGTTSAGGGPC